MTRGFEDWTKRDYQQFVKGVEKHGRYVIQPVVFMMTRCSYDFSSRSDDYEGIAQEIADKNAEEVKVYAKVFWKRWTELSGMRKVSLTTWCSGANLYLIDYPRLVERFNEAVQRKDERERQEQILADRVSSVKFPMQELPIPYGAVKQKIYSEEEDRYLLCRLAHYGLSSEDVYEKIKRDISEFPVFRFDWFFKSRTPQELGRRCAQLLLLLTKDKGDKSLHDFDEDFGPEEVIKPRTTKVCPLS